MKITITPQPVVDKQSHSAIRRLANKVLRYPLNLYYNRFYARHPDWPWLTPSTIRWLQSNLDLKMVGFEWGSGRSTLFFSARTRQLTSIEHDQDWFGLIESKLTTLPTKNVDYRFIPEGEKISQPVRNTHWKTTDYIINRPSFKEYCEAILDFDNDTFDYVIVDGRARVACALNAIDKIKPGGYLIFDNTERDHYNIVLEYLEGKKWTISRFPCWISETTILVKPKT